MTYSEDQKSNALAALAANGGNLSKTARELSLPRTTLKHWRDGVGIRDEVSKSGQEKKETLAEILETQIRAALQHAAGKVTEANYSQLMTGIGIMMDKLQLLRGEPTSITQQNLSDDERVQRVETLLREARKRKEGFAGK